MVHDNDPRFQHVQPGYAKYEASYHGALDYIDGAIKQIASCPNLYTSKITADELQRISDYIAIMKLEAKLFEGSTPKWRNELTQRELVTQRQALLALKEKLTDPGRQFIARYRTNMDFANLQCKTRQCSINELAKRGERSEGIGWTDTAVRAAHAWAIKELNGLRMELEPLAMAARQRMERYKDSVDVTDRYSGFRRNLGYLKRNDVNADRSALDAVMESTIRPPIAPRYHLGPDRMRAEAVGTENYTVDEDELSCKPYHLRTRQPYDNVHLDPREMAGINTKYPGHTEYDDSYRHPLILEAAAHHDTLPTCHRATDEQPKGVRGRGEEITFDPVQLQSKGYRINPAPNYMKEFAPMSEEMKEDWHLPMSETAESFRWPGN